MAAQPENATQQLVLQVLTDAKFQERLDVFARFWRARDYPNLFLDERGSDFDETNRRMVYYGLYYDLRELCDAWRLPWPEAGGMLTRYLWYLDHGKTNLNELLLPPALPPQRYWAWWRIARRGLGHPSNEEIEALRRLDEPVAKETAAVGLTYHQIAKLAGTSDRTIQEAVKQCWHYLENTGHDTRQIARLAGLDDYDGFVLLFVLDARRERSMIQNKQKRSHRRETESLYIHALRIWARGPGEQPATTDQGAKPEA